MGSDRSNRAASGRGAGWRKGCGTMALILGIAAVAVIALLLAGYPVSSLRDEARDRSEIVKQLDSLVDVVDDFFGGDDPATTLDGGGPPQPTSTWTPTPTATRTPTPPPPTATWTPTPVPDDSDTQPQPVPDPEPDDAPLLFVMDALGLSFKTREYYSVGNMSAGVAKPDAYAFVKSSFPSMRVELRTMPTYQATGETSRDALQALYQERLVEGLRDSGEWSIVSEPFDLQVNGQPASRMAAEFARTDDKVFCYHLTTIRGAARSGFVRGSYGAACEEGLGRLDEITEIADSVELGEPGAVCWVGQKPDTDPTEYAVGCDYPPLKYVGVDSLDKQGYTDKVLGLVTYDEAVAFMREQDQPRW